MKIDRKISTVLLSLFIGLSASWLFLFFRVPRPLFSSPCSTLLYSAEGDLLGARIAPDGQWRFPAGNAIPEKFETCLLTYEDKRFFYHPGVDPAALLRAIWKNARSGTILSGGRKLTMQHTLNARGNL